MIYYCFANRLNIGDYLSMLGVKQVVGLPGEEVIMEGRASNLLQVLQSASSADCFIIGGGGLFMNYFAPFWKAILKYQQQRKFKLYLFGIGVCDHKYAESSTVLNQTLLDQILASSEIRFLRPPISEQWADTHKTFCPSMAYIYRHYYQAVESQSRSILYVSHPGLIGKDRDENLRRDIALYAAEKNLEFSVTDNIAVNGISVDDILSSYQSARLIVSTRLHGYIIGRCLGKKMLAVSFDNKFEGFAQLVGDQPPLSPTGLSREILWQEITGSEQISSEKIQETVIQIENLGMQMQSHIQSWQ